MAKAPKVVNEEVVEEVDTATETDVTEEVAAKPEAEASDPVAEDEPDAIPDSNSSDYIANHNKFGHRIAVVNDLGALSFVDDDTALILFRNPGFYRELFDPSRGMHIPVHMFRWADNMGHATSLVVGQQYEAVEV